MTLRNVLGDIALDSSVQEIKTEISAGELLQAIEAMRMALQALTRSIGLTSVDTGGRLRVNVETGGVSVSTMTNQTNIGSIAATDQVPAIMHLSADNLRRNITVS